MKNKAKIVVSIAAVLIIALVYLKINSKQVELETIKTATVVRGNLTGKIKARGLTVTPSR